MLQVQSCNNKIEIGKARVELVTPYDRVYVNTYDIDNTLIRQLGVKGGL